MTERLITKSSGISIGLLIGLIAGVIIVVAAWKDLSHGQADLAREWKRTVKVIQSSRWCELDDKMYMQAFAQQNALTMPPHGRVQGYNSLDVPGTN